jgi:hypothetical protein
MADENVGLQVNYFLRESLDALWICITPAIIDPNVVPIPPAEFLKPLLEYDDAFANVGIAFGDRH